MAPAACKHQGQNAAVHTQAGSPTNRPQLFPSKFARDLSLHFLLCQAEATAVCALVRSKNARRCLRDLKHRAGTLYVLRKLWLASLPSFLSAHASPGLRPLPCCGSWKASSEQHVHTSTFPISRAPLESRLQPGLLLYSWPGPWWSCPRNLGDISMSK